MNIDKGSNYCWIESEEWMVCFYTKEDGSDVWDFDEWLRYPEFDEDPCGDEGCLCHEYWYITRPLWIKG